MNYAQHLLIYGCIYVIAALGLNVVVGFLGRLTLAQGAYFGFGAYAYALGTTAWHWSPVASFGLAILAPAVLSVLISVPAWRFRGDFFVLVSLAVQLLAVGLLNNWFDPNAAVGTLRNPANGTFGIADIPRIGAFGWRAESLTPMLCLSAGVMVLAGGFVGWLLSSPWGRMLKSIRDDDLAAAAIGKNVKLATITTFALSSGLLGIAGALYASYVGYIDPSVASLDQSVLLLAMVIVGGGGNSFGPFVGAVLLVALPELLRLAKLNDTVAANGRMILYGLALILLMHFRPQGLAGEHQIE